MDLFGLMFSGLLKTIIISIWVFPKIGVPQNGWYILENLIKMDDLGKPTIFGNIHMGNCFVWDVRHQDHFIKKKYDF